jgi:RNA polymerase sigma factor (sigma-70 family)
VAATAKLDGVVQQLRRVAALTAPAALRDGELLERFIREHDPAAFEALVRRHGPMVLGVCRRVLRHEADAEDAFQATFLVLVRRAAKVVPRSLVGNWLYGVAHHTALKARAMRTMRSVKERAAGQRPRRTNDRWPALEEMLDEELSRLADKYRVPIVLCDLEGRTIREVAAQLGWPQGTVAGRLARGRRLLAQRLVRRGLTLSAGAVGAIFGEGIAAGATPNALVAATLQSAAIMTGSSAGLISLKVTALVEGVLKAMLLKKLQVALALVLLGLAAIGMSARSLATGPSPETMVARVAAVTVERAQAAQAVFRGAETAQVDALAFSADGRLLAAGAHDKKVRIWDMRDNKLKRTLAEPKGTVRTVAFSSDGALLAAGADDCGVYVWNVASGKLEAVLRAELPRRLDQLAHVNGLVFLPQGKLAAAYNYDDLRDGDRHGQIQVWDLRDKKATKLLEHEGSVYSLALSPDGTLLAATLNGSFDGFKVWSVEQSKVVWEQQAGADFMTTVVFAPDGLKLAVGGGHSVAVNGGFRAEGRLWMFDIKTRKQLWYFPEPANWAYRAIVFSADSKALFTGSSGALKDTQINGAKGQKVVSELRRWDPSAGKMLWSLECELGNFCAVAATADGKTLAGADDAQLMLFDPESPTLREVLLKANP